MKDNIKDRITKKFAFDICLELLKELDHNIKKEDYEILYYFFDAGYTIAKKIDSNVLDENRTIN